MSSAVVVSVIQTSNNMRRSAEPILGRRSELTSTIGFEKKKNKTKQRTCIVICVCTLVFVVVSIRKSVIGGACEISR